MIPFEVQQWLDRIAPVLEIVRRRAADGIRNYCDENGFAYVGRDKESQSVAEKLETGRVAGLSLLDDLFGCSIIVPSLSHEGQVLTTLDRMFERVELRERHSTKKDPEVFRFQATRFIGRLRITDADDPRLAEVRFEVQIRTAFEHAWSVATHSPAYKSNRVDWRLERLAAQMKALVEQLDSLADSYHQSADVIVAHPCPRTEAESRILAWFLQLKENGWVPEECEPTKWGLFAKNVLELIWVSDWGSPLPVEERIDRLETAVFGEMGARGKANFPRTLSLYQYVLGALVERETIKPRMRRPNYFAPISEALEQYFPKTRAVQPRCNLTDAGHADTAGPTHS